MDEDSTNDIPQCGVVMKHLSGDTIIIYGKSHQTWDWLQTTTPVWRCEHDHSSGAGPEVFENDFTTAQTQLIHKAANYASNKSQFNTRLSSLAPYRHSPSSCYWKSAPSVCLPLSYWAPHWYTILLLYFLALHTHSRTHTSIHTLPAHCLTAASNMQHFVFCPQGSYYGLVLAMGNPKIIQYWIKCA